MRILMISYIEMEKEGRLKRCFEAVSKEHEVVLIQKSDRPSEHNIYNISLTSGRNMKRYMEFCIKIRPLIQHEMYDCIYAHNYFTALPAIMANWNNKAKLVYDAYELYYPAGTKHFSKRDYFFYFFEKKIIKRANAVICANEERALLMTGFYHLNQLPHVVENIPLERPEIYYTEEDSCAPYRIVYAGYLSKERQLLALIEAVEQKEGKFTLHIYGTGELETEIRRHAESSAAIYFYGAYDNDELPSILRQYDIGFISYPNKDFNTIFCSPNKIYDYLLNGLILLGTENYKLKKIMEQNGYGVCKNQLGEGLDEIALNFNQYKRQLVQYLNHFTWNAGMHDTLLSLLKQLQREV